MAHHIKYRLLFLFLVVALLCSTLILSTLAHELIHVAQIATSDSITEVDEVCVAGWLRGTDAIGWVFHTDDELKDVAKNSEYPAYYFQLVVMLICLYLSSKILYIFCKEVR